MSDPSRVPKSFLLVSENFAILFWSKIILVLGSYVTFLKILALWCRISLQKRFWLVFLYNHKKSSFIFWLTFMKNYGLCFLLTRHFEACHIFLPLIISI